MTLSVFTIAGGALFFCWLARESAYWSIRYCDSFLGIGGREPLVSIFPKCIDVLRCRIVQCGGESHHMR